VLNGQKPTHSSRLIFYRADSQRMSLIGDRGEQRECRELQGTPSLNHFSAQQQRLRD
jgi:hypothetical protein